MVLLLSAVGFTQTNLCVEVNQKLSNSNLYSSIVSKAEAVIGNTLVIGNADVTVDQLDQALLQAYPQSAFRITGDFKSPSDKSVTVYQYVQTISGKEIENGGYTVSARGTGTGPGPQPCHSIVAFSPNLYSLSSGSSLFNEKQARNFAFVHKPQVSEIGNVSLSVLHEGATSCKILTYKIIGIVDNKLSAIYVNAYDGSLSSFEEIKEDNINAPTLYYGDQDMLERFIPPNEFLLQSDNGVVTYDYSRISGTGWNYDDSNIPTRQAGGLWPIDGLAPNLSSHIYQTHHVATSIVQPLSDIGIKFDNFFVKAESVENAVSRGQYDDRTNSYIRIGTTNQSSVTNQRESFATYDIVGHEIGHSFISRFFLASANSSGRDGRTLHEGLADIIGTYAEFGVQGFSDLVVGDDSPNLLEGQSLLSASRSGDLEGHPFPCFLSIPDCDDPRTRCHYDRSGPIVRWFAYLVTGASILDGVVSTNIEVLDIQDAASIVTESITMLNGSTATIPDLRDATLATALIHYGECSKEYSSIAHAWNEVCVGNTPTCEFIITGPRSICDNALTPIFFYVDDPLPGETYRWNFPFDWDVEGVSGSNYTNGNFIKVTNIPSYTSYPVSYKIRVFPITSGASYTEELKGQIRNCSGKPCGKSLSKSSTLIQYSEQDKKILSDASSVVIYDVMGRSKGQYQIVNGKVSEQVLESLDSHSVFIFSYLNDNGDLLHSEKKVIIR
jgi:hypothetical protein